MEYIFAGTYRGNDGCREERSAVEDWGETPEFIDAPH